MTSDIRTNTDRHVAPHTACVQSQWNTKWFGLVIGPNDVVLYDVTLFPAFSWTKRHFRWSNKRLSICHLYTIQIVLLFIYFLERQNLHYQTLKQKILVAWSSEQMLLLLHLSDQSLVYEAPAWRACQSGRYPDPSEGTIASSARETPGLPLPASTVVTR